MDVRPDGPRIFRVRVVAAESGSGHARRRLRTCRSPPGAVLSATRALEGLPLARENNKSGAENAGVVLRGTDNPALNSMSAVYGGFGLLG